MTNIETDQLSMDIDLLSKRQRSGWTLERLFYTDLTIYDLELESIFCRNWLYVGHVDRIRRPSDFFLTEIAGESIIVSRGDDGRVYALMNVCRHRGSRVCLEPAGHASHFVCPYHQWTYRSDGSLQSAPATGGGLDQADLDLHRAKVEVLEGMIFISLAQDPLDFEAMAQTLRPHLAPYELARTQICYTEVHDVGANWKIVLENARECYHCPGNHPQLCKIMPVTSLNAPQLPQEQQQMYAQRQAEWEAVGLEARIAPLRRDRWYHLMRYPLCDGIVTQSLDGQRVGPLLGQLDHTNTGVLGGGVGPCMWLEISCDHAVLLQIAPISVAQTRVRLDWVIHEDAREKIDADPQKVKGFWSVTGQQDWKLCENAQAGINSHYYVPGPYADIETGTRTFIEWYLDQMRTLSAN